MLLSACGSDVTQSPGEGSTQAPDETAAEELAPEPEGETTLVVWDVMTRPEENAILDKLIADYEAANPGVTVLREAKSFDDLKTTAALALSNPDGPDIVQSISRK